MSELEARLKRLEENFGLDDDLKDKAERGGNWLILTAYKDGDCPERFIPQAESLIAKHGSLEAAEKACGEVDLSSIERVMTKEEKEEYERLKKEIFG